MEKRRNRFYIASSFKHLSTLTAITEMLKNTGFVRTYDWDKNNRKSSLSQLKVIAQAEYEGIENCDFFVFIFPGGKGANIEFGIATALGKPIYVFDTTDSIDDLEETSSFYQLAHVRKFYGTIAGFKEFILVDLPTQL